MLPSGVTVIADPHSGFNGWLAVIMVGQKAAAKASDKQALQTYKDAEALLKIQDELHKWLKINNELALEIHRRTVENNGSRTP